MATLMVPVVSTVYKVPTAGSLAFSDLTVSTIKTTFARATFWILKKPNIEFSTRPAPERQHTDLHRKRVYLSKFCLECCNDLLDALPFQISVCLFVQIFLK